MLQWKVLGLQSESHAAVSIPGIIRKYIIEKEMDAKVNSKS